MPAPHYFRAETLVALAPWAIASVACVLAFVLLAQFIDTLDFQMQRGQALRAGQSTSVVVHSDAPGHGAIDRTQLAGIQP